MVCQTTISNKKKRNEKHNKQQLEKFAMVLADIASMNKTVKAINSTIVSKPSSSSQPLIIKKNNVMIKKGCHGKAQWGKSNKWYPCTVLATNNNNGKLIVRWDVDSTISKGISKNKFLSDKEQQTSHDSKKQIAKNNNISTKKRQLAVVAEQKEEKQPLSYNVGCHGIGQFGKGGKNMKGKWYPCVIISRNDKDGTINVKWEQDGTISTLPKKKFRCSDDDETSTCPPTNDNNSPSKRRRKITSNNNTSVGNVTTKADDGNDKCTTTSDVIVTKKISVQYNMSKTPHFKRKAVYYQQMKTLKQINHDKKRRFHHHNNNNNNSNDTLENTFLSSSSPSSILSSDGSSSIPTKTTTRLGDSVIWYPKNRNEWLDCSSELASLCAEASLRSALSSPKTIVTYTSSSSTKRGSTNSSTNSSSSTNGSSSNNKKIKLITPIVISKDYIEQRLDIDDPLNGFQVRHAEGGWLQGFALWTTFTSWTRYYKWDSLHVKSGMAGSQGARAAVEEGRLVDEDGQLASELEEQSRSGDPHEGGVIWPTIAEISLVGGLGCGEFLLRMAMEKIRTEGKGYKYIVLQATESSRRFYERFGFRRVGAVCKYTSESICGYRHWANADEKNLEYHGGPSYMMAKKIDCNESKDMTSSDLSSTSSSFLCTIEACVVDRKPTILPHSKQDTFIQSSEFFSANEWIQKAEIQTKS